MEGRWPVLHRDTPTRSLQGQGGSTESTVLTPARDFWIFSRARAMSCRMVLPPVSCRGTGGQRQAGQNRRHQGGGKEKARTGAKRSAATQDTKAVRRCTLIVEGGGNRQNMARLPSRETLKTTPEASFIQQNPCVLLQIQVRGV